MFAKPKREEREVEVGSLIGQVEKSIETMEKDILKLCLGHAPKQDSKFHLGADLYAKNLTKLSDLLVGLKKEIKQINDDRLSGVSKVKSEFDLLSDSTESLNPAALSELEVQSPTISAQVEKLVEEKKSSNAGAVQLVYSKIGEALKASEALEEELEKLSKQKKGLFNKPYKKKVGEGLQKLYQMIQDQYALLAKEGATKTGRTSLPSAPPTHRRSSAALITPDDTTIGTKPNSP